MNNHQFYENGPCTQNISFRVTMILLKEIWEDLQANIEIFW